MSPRRSTNSRSRLKLDSLLPCALALSTLLLTVKLQTVESTPNSRFLQATEQQADQSNGFTNEPAQIGNQPTPLAIEAIQNVTASEKLLELIGQQTQTSSAARDLNDLIMQQAAAAAAASTDQQLAQLGAMEQVEARPEASLAHSTAAGTVAGLRLAQDLIAQANMVEKSPYGQQEGGEQSMGPIDGADNDDSDGDGDGDAQSQAHSEGDQRNQPEESNNPEELQLQQAARRQMVADSQAQQAPETEVQDGEPLNESQVPDSIESLMGADLDEAGAAQLDDQSDADEADGQQQQQQQQPSGSVPLQMTRQLTLNQAAAPQETNEDAEEDEDDNENPTERREVARAEGSKAPAMFEAPPIELAQGDLMSNFRGGRHSFGAGAPELNHNLVAPMRDSLEDLNAAAGHYYGKKKKEKKVKKIIIKKKKKRKKKKMKIKKIKIIKIKKVKKKKKGKKHYPKKKHHKHHHGHDHGKYYMYAKVPKKKAWEFGFKKGNKKHWISRHEKGYKNKFKTKVKWFDKKSKGKGFHVWDYNHHDKKKKGHHHH